MKITNSLQITTRKEWHAWLKKNHASERELWLVFHRKTTGKPVLDYEDAVEEALCFGWIDSIIQKIDEEKYARKFNPRMKGSKWSDVNIRRVKKLIEENKMQPAGMQRINPEIFNRKPDKQFSGKNPEDTPSYIKEAFSVDKDVITFFNALAPSHRKNYILWISSAKREETRNKRITEALILLKNKQKLGLK